MKRDELHIETTAAANELRGRLERLLEHLSGARVGTRAAPAASGCLRIGAVVLG